MLALLCIALLCFALLCLLACLLVLVLVCFDVCLVGWLPGCLVAWWLGGLVGLFACRMLASRVTCPQKYHRHKKGTEMKGGLRTRLANAPARPLPWRQRGAEGGGVPGPRRRGCEGHRSFGPPNHGAARCPSAELSPVLGSSSCSLCPTGDFAGGHRVALRALPFDAATPILPKERNGTRGHGS